MAIIAMRDTRLLCEINVRDCCFHTTVPGHAWQRPPVPQSIPATVDGRTRLAVGEDGCCGTFCTAVLVSVVPDDTALVVGGVDLPLDVPRLRLAPPEGGGRTISADDFAPIELRLGFCRALNQWLAHRELLGNHFRLIFPGLGVLSRID